MYIVNAFKRKKTTANGINIYRIHITFWRQERINLAKLNENYICEFLILS